MHTKTKCITTHVYCDRCFLEHLNDKVLRVCQLQICKSTEKYKQHHGYEIQMKINLNTSVNINYYEFSTDLPAL